jgi:hypothetical protein
MNAPQDTAASPHAEANPCAAAAAWTPIRVPPVPAELQSHHVAHSVTAALSVQDMLAPSYGWAELRTEPSIPDAPDFEGARSDDIKETIDAGIALLPALWAGARPGNALVFFGCGTVVLCDGASGPLFAGFVTGDGDGDDDGSGSGNSDEVRSAQTGGGRGGDAIPYQIPITRLAGGASTGRSFLHDAQLRLDAFAAAHPAEEPFARKALAAFTQAGYPNPGTPGSNADVVALWHRRRAAAADGEGSEDWLALVRCHAFGAVSERMGVLVRFAGEKPPPLAPFAMKQFADGGRDRYRYDFLSPRIEHVHIFPGGGGGGSELAE